MSILLDSASVDDAAKAAELGFVGGVTTNPTLMARVTVEPLAQLARLLAAFPRGPMCYQPTAESVCGLADEARVAAALAPDRVVIKLPATTVGVQAAATLTGERIRCALTAVYSQAQALLAHETGCVWAIPYVDRAARQGAGGLDLVAALAAVLAQLRSDTRVLAASLKSGPQVVESMLHGAHDVTAALDVLLELPEHPLSDAAVREFAAAARSRDPQTLMQNPQDSCT
jgi:transaldolase